MRAPSRSLLFSFFFFSRSLARWCSQILIGSAHVPTLVRSARQQHIRRTYEI
jgi:hypothetical protein